MTKRLLQGSALACVLLFAACSAPTSGSAADEATIRAMGGKYADAFNKSDVPALAGMVTDDYEAVSADGTDVKGKAAYEDMEKKSAAQRAGMPLKLTIDTTYVKWAGADHASIGGKWTMAGVPAGMGADNGAWTGMAEKGTDGQWRLASGLVASNPPPAMPMPTTTPVAKAPAKGRGK